MIAKEINYTKALLDSHIFICPLKEMVVSCRDAHVCMPKDSSLTASKNKHINHCKTEFSPTPFITFPLTL